MIVIPDHDHHSKDLDEVLGGFTDVTFLVELPRTDQVNNLLDKYNSKELGPKVLMDYLYAIGVHPFHRVTHIIGIAQSNECKILAIAPSPDEEYESAVMSNIRSVLNENKELVLIIGSAHERIIKEFDH